MAGPKDYLNCTAKEILELIDLGNLNGMFHTKPEKGCENFPLFQFAEAEGKDNLSSGCVNGNSLIILGKDRNGDFATGFGGTKNKPASHAIDLVVGLSSSHRKFKKAFGKDTEVGKNFFTDAARVYISQRTDLNRYFGVTEGESYASDSSEGCSGVGIKADMVLLNGRRNIKIRAGGAHGNDLPRGGEKMAHGEDIPSKFPRIELVIANMPVEPAVLGDKLLALLTSQSEAIQNLKSEVVQLNTDLALLRMQLALHVHGDPLTALTLPSPDQAVAASIAAPKAINNVVVGIYDKFKEKINELGTLSIPNSGDYILSKSVFVS